MRIGIIWVGYQCEDTLKASLDPWVAAKRANLGGHTFVICAVSVPFAGFPQEEHEDDTRPILGWQVATGGVDHAIIRDKPMKETEARGAALKWLVSGPQSVELLIQWDSDEVATVEEISRIIAFVEGQPFVPTFRLSYRNLVFTPDQWLAEPFTPMRIHRVYAHGGYIAAGFWDDNNVCYQRPWEGESGALIRDTDMACITIPPTVAHPAHWTWLNTERSRRKCAYQVARGWSCAFSWDDTKGGLIWNEEHFARQGLPLPEVIRE